MAPTTETLTAERILEATEEVLRRHGPAKATVVDVARALGVSHGSVYRHFRTKAALREAVTKRWLDRTSQTLSGITADETRAPDARLRDWLAELFDAKRRKAGDDPELFATYMVLVPEIGSTVTDHIDDLTGQLTLIIEAGVESGTFATPDPRPPPEPSSRPPAASTTPPTPRSGNSRARRTTSGRWWNCCCWGCGPSSSPDSPDFSSEG